MDKITQAGIYQLSNDDYHGDCCDGPSLSSSKARLLMETCPAKVYANIRTESKSFDIGSAAHLIYLEPSDFAERTSIVQANDWRTKAAQEARDFAYQQNKIPLLPKNVEELEHMRNALFSYPLAAQAFSGGKAEQSLFYKDEQTGVWIKARPDYLPDHYEWVVDYKTAASANPREFARSVYQNGYYQQAAWYIDSIEAVTGKKPKDFWFVVQEKEAPYLVSVIKLDDGAIDWGRMINRRAIDLFAQCCESQNWHGYRDPQCPTKDKAFVIGLPDFAKFQLEERRESGEFLSK